MDKKMKISLTVNGRAYAEEVETRMLLSDFLRHQLGLKGTHVGCEHGVCGACTVSFDGEPVRSCLMLAVQADGHQIKTIEGLAESPEHLHPLQEGFRDAHGLQCGYCTPGILMTLEPFLARIIPSRLRLRSARRFRGICAAARDTSILLTESPWQAKSSKNGLSRRKNGRRQNE